MDALACGPRGGRAGPGRCPAARAKKKRTLVDGIIFYDLEKEKEVMSEIQKERAELINFMLDAKNKGMKTQLPKKKENGHYHCDTLGENCKESHYKYN